MGQDWRETVAIAFFGGATGGESRGWRETFVFSFSSLEAGAEETEWAEDKAGEKQRAGKPSSLELLWALRADIQDTRSPYDEVWINELHVLRFTRATSSMPVLGAVAGAYTRQLVAGCVLATSMFYSII